MRLISALLLAVMLISIPLLSACDLLGIKSKQEKEQEYFEQQLEYYNKVQEANQKAQEEYNRQVQESLQQYLDEYSEYQQDVKEQQIKEQYGEDVIIVTESANQTTGN